MALNRYPYQTLPPGFFSFSFSVFNFVKIYRTENCFHFSKNRTGFFLTYHESVPESYPPVIRGESLAPPPLDNLDYLPIADYLGCPLATLLGELFHQLPLHVLDALFDFCDTIKDRPYRRLPLDQRRSNAIYEHPSGKWASLTHGNQITTGDSLSLIHATDKAIPSSTSGFLPQSHRFQPRDASGSVPFIIVANLDRSTDPNREINRMIPNRNVIPVELHFAQSQHLNVVHLLNSRGLKVPYTQ